MVSSSRAAAREQAVRTMRRWRFKPALLDREPVPVRISVDMKFALR
jgi:outer membrane biosynthesis protein TonB